jgi:hypothetical protein
LGLPLGRLSEFLGLLLELGLQLVLILDALNAARFIHSAH